MGVTTALAIASLCLVYVLGSPAPPQPSIVSTRGLKKIVRLRRAVEWECEDATTNCGRYKNSGYCQTSSRYYTYMVKACPVTCDFCKDVCKDFVSQCPDLKAQGHCATSSSLYSKMKNNCRKSCGLCGDCEDYSEHCVYWAGVGYCQGQYQAYMKANCQKSCGTCTSPTTTAAPTTTGPTTTQVTLTEEQQACLDIHNEKRSLHGSPALEWDSTLVEDAQNWVDYLSENDTFAHDNDRGATGENLYGGTGSSERTFNEAVESWYSEESVYNYDTPGLSDETGHFTQLVWKATKKVACAKASKQVQNGIKTVIVARYTPQGNNAGQFSENVSEKV